MEREAIYRRSLGRTPQRRLAPDAVLFSLSAADDASDTPCQSCSPLTIKTVQGIDTLFYAGGSFAAPRIGF